MTVISASNILICHPKNIKMDFKSHIINLQAYYKQIGIFKYVCYVCMYVTSVYELFFNVFLNKLIDRPKT